MQFLIHLFIILTLVISQTVMHAESLYKWKDSKGNIQYGDKPPPNADAKSLELPKITIIDKYSDQWKPVNVEDSNINKEYKNKSRTYSSFLILTPTPNQSVRANNGVVSASVSIKPFLKEGHKLVFSINGKATEKVKSLTKNFTGLNRGENTITVNIIDSKGKILKTNSVTFFVLRKSSLRNNLSD